MKKEFTEDAKEALNIAGETAIMLKQSYIGTEHLLVGLVKAGGVASAVFEENLVYEDRIKELISDNIAAPGLRVSVPSVNNLSPRARHVVEQSFVEAGKLKSEKVGTEHLLLALIKEGDCIAVRLLSSIGVNLQKLYYDTMTAIGIDTAKVKKEMKSKAFRGGNSLTPTLDQYSRDMTTAAANGKIDMVVGRDSEIERIVQILSRRTKNNPCLVGEPGVGKTAIVEGLARRIVAGNVPDTIKGKRLVALDLSGIVAGTKYRGEFEERIKKVIEEVVNAGNVMLFLDELHTMIGAGGAEGSIDASNILKPSLARGEIQLIGATTNGEYRKYIEKNPALERRFQPVTVEEPTEEETLSILKGLRSAYEEHHHVSITDEALLACVKLSHRYINDRFLPDKAIDLMDEAASRVALSVYKPTDQEIGIDEKLRKLAEQKEEAVINEQFELAANIKKKQEKLKKEKDKLKEELLNSRKENKLTVNEGDIAAIVSGWTKIPVKKLEEEESRKLMKLEETLHGRVVGQEEAVSAVAKAIRRGRVGLKDPNRPIGSFMFLGPTGVGKTELSKALSEAVFGTEDSIIRIDMSEYMEQHSVSKIIGSPPGYVGFDEGGQLSEKVRRHPYSVVLFDEIEKAHPDVFNILLQVLDDGHITDSKGRKVSFKNTIIIMTSNAGASSIMSPKLLGFATESDAKADFNHMKEGVMEEVKKIFKPEFLNRIDEIICFHSLGREEIRAIVSLLADKVIKRAKDEMELKITCDDSFIDHIAEKGFDEKYGARPLKRAIQTELEDLLAGEILEGRLAKGNSVKVSYDAAAKKVVFKKRGKTVR